MGGKRRRKSASSSKVGHVVNPPAQKAITPAPLPPDRIRYDADALFPKAERLTTREAEALEWAVQGKANAAIADEMRTAKRTVETYISQALAKLSVRTRPELIALYRDARERLLRADNDRLQAKVEALETQLATLRRQLRRLS